MSDPTPDQLDNLVRWAQRCYIETNDPGRCRWYLGTGTCSFGCRDEPECQTCIWPIDTLGDPDENNDVPTIKGWLSDLLDPFWHDAVFGVEADDAGVAQ